MNSGRHMQAVATLARLFWWDSARKTRAEAIFRLCAVISTLLVRARFGVWLSNVRRIQAQHLLQGSGSFRVFLRAFVRYTVSAAVLSPVNKIYWRLLRSLRLQWEMHLTRHLLQNFLEAQCLRADRPIDERENLHPDQRIAADVGKFVQLVTALGLDTLQSVIDLWFYSRLLHSLSPILAKSTVLLAAIGTLFTHALGRRIPHLYQAERFADGHFTYLLTRMKENAESICFYSAQDQETSLAISALSQRQSTEWERLAAKDVVQLASEQYKKLFGLLPTILLVRTFTGNVDGAILAQGNETFEAVLRSLFLLADNCNDFSRLFAVATELHSYYWEQNARAAHSGSSRPGTGGDISATPIEIDLQPLNADVENVWLRITKLSLHFQGRYLVSNLNLEASSDGGLLISGPSGSGKTTLLRAIAGLWRHGGRGTIQREMRTGYVLFLPQRPYMRLGSLREQLLYPFGSSSKLLTAEIQNVLHRLGLSRLVDDLDTVCRWEERLSMGEQQRIAIARILVQRPAYAILDEATSANDEVHERIMYELVQETCSGYLSVGHRSSLLQFHARALRLFAAGRWELNQIK